MQTYIMIIHNLKFQEMVSTLFAITVTGNKSGRCIACQDIRKLDKFISDQCTYPQGPKPGLPRHQVLEFILYSLLLKFLKYMGAGEGWWFNVLLLVPSV